MTREQLTPNALSVSGLTKRYGAVVAVDDVSLEIPAGERRAVIGPNGAGKSTLFALIAGTMAPSAGRVALHGDDVTRLRDHRRAQRGLVKTFQHSSLFTGVSLLDNVLLATQRIHGRPGNPFGRCSERSVVSAKEALELVGLADRSHIRAGLLSHGERRQLEIAVALGAEPAVLLLDEPTAGMSASETDKFVTLLNSLPGEVTVLIIEHDLDVVFSVADRVTVLHLGAVLAEGSPEEIRSSQAVQHTYLGVVPDPSESRAIGGGIAVDTQVSTATTTGGHA